MTVRKYSHEIKVNKVDHIRNLWLCLTCIIVLTFASILWLTIRSGDFVLPKMTVEVSTVHREHRLPDALIIGVMKGGTRAATSFLSAHPLVRAAPGELHFFDRYFHRGISWYINHLPSTHPNETLIEKTPAYFYTPFVPARVRHVKPTMKLILVVRNPVDRAMSAHLQNLAKTNRNYSYENFSRHVFKDSDFTVRASNNLIRRSVYDNDLLRWLNYFPLEQIHIMDGDKLLHDPASVVGDAEKFLQLPPPYLSKFDFYWNHRRGVHCLIDRNRRLKTADGCLRTSKGRRHPKIPSKDRQALRNYFLPFIERFNKLAGTNFTW